MTCQTLFRKQSPTVSYARPERRPAALRRDPANPRALAEGLLHELAFVLHVTHSVKRAVMAKAAPRREAATR
jgi:hypothetical protein